MENKYLIRTSTLTEVKIKVDLDRLLMLNEYLYHLETLIKALPDSIIREYKNAEDGTIEEFEEKLIITKDRIYYKCYDLETSDDADKYLREYGYYTKSCEVVKSWDSKSLADTAGRLLIELSEAGIINFKK